MQVHEPTTLPRQGSTILCSATPSSQAQSGAMADPLIQCNGGYDAAPPPAGTQLTVSPRQATVINPFVTSPDIISYLADYVDTMSFIFFASVSRGWRAAWRKRPTTTRALTADTSVSQLKFSFECGLRRAAAVCGTLARLGKVDLLESAREKGCPWNEDTCYGAAEEGHLPVLQYARANGCRWGRDTCLVAARNGHLAILQWAHEHGGIWDIGISTEAAEAGQLHALEFLHANGCPLGPSVCAGAARGGHLHVIQWLRAVGCPWNSNTCSLAAEGGHLDVLKWALETGCPWNNDVWLYAREGGHQPIIRWARSRCRAF